MTISEYKKIFTENLLLNYTRSESAELYSIFIEKAIGYNKFKQRQSGNEMLSEIQLNSFKNIVSDLKTGKPFQQILGETEFYGLKFFVDAHVLIPRPETEELLEVTISKIKISGVKSDLKILDIGTGSGIIAIVLKKHFPQAKVYAIDVSKEALETAKRNAVFNQVEISFVHQDYLAENLTDIFDVIISNPPYIGINEEDEIENSVKGFEPKIALFSPTKNALVFYEKIAKDCEKYLSENGFVFLEINQKLGIKTKQLFLDVLSEVELLKDLSGNERFVWGRK